MKRTCIVKQPCVIVPANRLHPEKHVIHGTHWRAQRNARMTAHLGFRYHVHETVVPTLWGHLVNLAHRLCVA